MNVVPLTPIGQLKILKDVPLDNTYTDTLDFSSASAQYTFFSGKAKYTFTNMGPNRLTNQVKVERNYDDLYDCNYIMFQNTNFGNKWFYAFITSIEYVNPNNTFITYEIDVFQTWQFDYTLNECLVERMHTPDDTPFKYLAGEPISVENYIYNTSMYWDGSFQTIFDTIPYITAIIGTGEKFEAPTATMRGGVYSGCGYHSEPATDDGASAMASYLNGIVQAGAKEQIVGVYMTPLKADNPVLPTHTNVATSFNRLNTSFSGYTIKNNKCLSYPFRKFILRSTDGGGRVELQPEMFHANTLSVGIWISGAVPISTSLVPFYNSDTENWDFSISYTENPVCAWTSSGFYEWMGTNLLTIPTRLIGNILQTQSEVSSLANIRDPEINYGGITGVVGSSFERSMGIINDIWQGTRLPNTTRGGNTSGGVNYLAYKHGYEGFCLEPIRSEIERIDNFFTCRGYAINDVVKPNLKSRPSFNYIKTRSANVTGSIPFADIATIKSAFNRGITFWHGDFVGDYSRNNSPS